MTKAKVIGILIGVAVIGCLAGVFVWVSELDSVQPPEPDNDLTLIYTNENAVIYKGELTQVDYLQIDNVFGSYRVRKNENGKIEIIGREQVPLFPYSSEAIYSSIAQVKCLSLIEKNAGQLSDYGLENPGASVSIVEKDQKTTRFFVGDQAPMSDGYYICMENSRDVYLVANTYAERYLSEMTYLYSNVLTKQIAYENLASVSLTRNGEEIFIRKTEGAETSSIEFSTGFVMERPIFCGAENTVLQTACDNLKNLKASGFAADLVQTEEEKARYGLDHGVKVVLTAAADTSSVMLSSGEKNPYYGLSNPDGSPYMITSTYLLGDVSEGFRYVMYDDSPVVYQVPSSAFDFADSDLYQFCQRLVNLKALSDLSALTLSFDGKNYAFQIEHGEENALTVTHDFSPVDSEAFRNFYVELVSLTHTGIGQKPEGEPLLSVTYTGTDGSVDLLELIPYPENPRKVFISLNGRGVFVTAATQAETLKAALLKLLS